MNGHKAGPVAGPGANPLHVVAVRSHRHRAPLLRPFVTAARRTEAVEYVVAEVELASGTIGQGSAAETLAVTGESAATITAALDAPLRAALEGVTDSLTGLAARAAGALARATSAKAAVEVALHDAWAKEAGLPLVELLGGRLGDGLMNDMTVSLEEPEVMADHAREAVAAGAQILKIKLGNDVALDRDRLAAVVEAAPEVRLRLDANQGWSPAQAITILTAFTADGLPIDLVEQPVPAADVEGLARVTTAVELPIMADEAVWSSADARRLLDAGACDLLNIKLAKTGGIREAIAIADLAEAAGVECMLGSMMEPRISITAAAHLAIAHPAITMIDLDPPFWFATDLPRGGFVQDGAWLRLSGGQGLGLELLRADDDPADGAATDDDPADGRPADGNPADGDPVGAPRSDEEPAGGDR